MVEKVLNFGLLLANSCVYQKHNAIYQCFSTFVRPRPGKFFFLQDEGPVPTNLLVNTFPIFF